MQKFKLLTLNKTVKTPNIFKAICLGFLFLIFVNSQVLARSVELLNKPIQGGLVFVKTYPNASVVFDGVKQRADEEGIFAIGLSRNAKPTKTIKISYAGRTFKFKFKVASRKYIIQRINGLKKNKVTPSKKFLKRIRREVREIKKARSFVSNLTYYKEKWINPTFGRITGVYGSMRILNGIPKTPHYGLDYATPAGTPVIAPQGGIVRMVQKNNFYSGKTVIIDHGHGVSSAFLHMSKLFVSVGQQVSQGDKIGAVGTSGRSTGAHLDWRINWYKKRLDVGLLRGIDLGTNPTGKIIEDSQEQSEEY